MGTEREPWGLGAHVLVAITPPHPLHSFGSGLHSLSGFHFSDPIRRQAINMPSSDENAFWEQEVEEGSGAI